MTLLPETVRLGLTTTPDQIRTLAIQAEAFGFEPISLPCIRIDILPPDKEQLKAAVSTADVLVVTSVRTVALLLSRGFPSLPTIAVGPETAKAAKFAGGVSEWVGSAGIHHLVHEAQHLLLGRNVVLAGASNSIARNAAAIEAAGASVVSVPLYTTVSIPPPSDPVDAVIFGSPSAVAGWIASRELSDLMIGVIGETTASAVREEGFEPDVLPENPGYVETIECMAELQAERTTS